MRVYDQERTLPHLRALARVLEALCAACVVVCVVALGRSELGWSLVFAIAACVCFELCAEIEP